MTLQNMQSSRLPMKYKKKYSYGSQSLYKSNLLIFPQLHFQNNFKTCSHGKLEATKIYRSHIGP